MKSITNSTLVFKNIIDLCEKHGFLKRVADVFQAGPIGALLQENLKREWFYITIINRDFSVFFNNSNFKDTFLYAKDLCSNKFPFGIAEILSNKEITNSTDIKNPINFKQILENDMILSCVTFLPSSESTRFFHQLQRQRRTWWRIFSALPSRYSLSDARVEVGHQYVDIHADYPWGLQVIESIKLSTVNHNAIDQNHLQCKVGRNTEAVHYVTNTISTSAMLLNTLCDAYEEPDSKGDGRLMFRFHRKLSPYKVSFALPKVKETSVREELIQLSLYICKRLRAGNVSTLLLPTASHTTLETQWNQYDQMGIPYNILFNQSTLTDGKAQLRSRDTTLKEQVLVAELPKYIEQLFRNY